MNSSILIARAAGTMLPLQAVLNARLARPLESPVWAAAISGVITTLTLFAIGFGMSRGLPRSVGGTDLPPWAWAVRSGNQSAHRATPDRHRLAARGRTTLHERPSP